MIIKCPINQYAEDSPLKAAIQSQFKSISYNELNKKIMTYQQCLQGLTDSIIGVNAKDPIDQIIIIWALLRNKKNSILLNPKLTQSEINQICHPLKIKTIISKVLVKEKTTASVSNNLNEHTVTYILTSGSTGTPKIVSHPIKNHIESQKVSQTVIPFEANNCWCWNLPFFHVSGLSILFRVFFSGGTLYLPAKREAFRNIFKHCSHISMVTKQFIDLIQEDKQKTININNMKSILIGGGHFPLKYRIIAIKRNWPVFITYGMTEAASQIATCRLTKETIKYDGKLLPHFKMKIQKNKIYIKGSSLFDGYLQTNHQLVLKKTSSDWFDTNDLGSKTKNMISIIGRADRMFISGGENIYPEEIEQKLLTVKGILDVYILPKKSKKYGFQPIAYLKTTANFKKIVILCMQLCNNELISFKHPVDYIQIK